jgi:hypothetical protein
MHQDKLVKANAKHHTSQSQSYKRNTGQSQRYTARNPKLSYAAHWPKPKIYGISEQEVHLGRFASRDVQCEASGRILLRWFTGILGDNVEMVLPAGKRLFVFNDERRCTTLQTRDHRPLAARAGHHTHPSRIARGLPSGPLPARIPATSQRHSPGHASTERPRPHASWQRT